LKLLLDTHALLWWQMGDRRLSSKARRAVASADLVYVSAASFWEIVIKAQLGKLDASLDDAFDISKDGFRELPIRGVHARAAGELPPHHKDPFDRMIAAQTNVEGLTLVTNDEVFALYTVRTLE
jgi:PIN domain nuclease of toxin-antitoxin system